MLPVSRAGGALVVVGASVVAGTVVAGTVVTGTVVTGTVVTGTVVTGTVDVASTNAGEMRASGVCGNSCAVSSGAGATGVIVVVGAGPRALTGEETPTSSTPPATASRTGFASPASATTIVQLAIVMTHIALRNASNRYRNPTLPGQTQSLGRVCQREIPTAAMPGMTTLTSNDSSLGR
jgi:hypothetical protein